MSLTLPRCSVSVSPSELRDAAVLSNGALLLEGLPAFPREALAETLNILHRRKDLAERLNHAYASNLVYKDAFAAGQGGPGVDCKRVLDLSPDRLASIAARAPEVCEDPELAAAMQAILPWWRSVEEIALPLVNGALELSCGPQVHEDVSTNYRMVDYYATNSPAESVVRCGEHRDFGAFTLVFSDVQGLQIEDNGAWKEVAAWKLSEAVLLFGWCTEIRSNGRILARLHRVRSLPERRRISAVFFCAPKLANTLLSPMILPGEQALFKEVKVGQLRGHMGRKWRRREGTLKDGERELEESEIRTTGMLTQDHVVASLKIH